MYCKMHENFFPHVDLVCAGGSHAGGRGGDGGVQWELIIC